MKTNWYKELDAIRGEFRDVARSYPKLFYARLIAPVQPLNSWEKLLGTKRYLQYLTCPSSDEYRDQYCLYADAGADELMCHHALQQFTAVALRTLRLIDTIPAKVWDVLSMPKESVDQVVSWLSVVDTLAARPGAPGEVKGFARDQFRALRNDKEPAKAVLYPILLHKQMAATLAPDIFPHRWLAVVSPDIATCSICALDEILRRLPDPATDFHIATWSDKGEGRVSWLVHDPAILESLSKSLGTPADRYDNTGTGVASSTLISRLDEINPGQEDATRYHQLVAQILNRMFSPYLSGMKIEREVNDGRKRIDLCFDNVADVGFFNDLKVAYQIKCPVIFVECKNYTSDPSNPELDQLQGRFGKQRGEFGCLVCRTLSDRPTMILRCRDIVHSGRGWVLVLTDSDLKSLWNLRAVNEAGFHQFLRERMNELIL